MVLLLFILMSLVVRFKSLVGCEKCVQKLSRNHFCRIYLSREVSAMLCCTCMPKYLKIIFHYSGSEMEYKCDSNNSRGSGESLFETLDLIKEYFNEISGGRIENAEHKNKKQILRRCGHWPVETPGALLILSSYRHIQCLLSVNFLRKSLSIILFWLIMIRFKNRLK